MSQPTAGEIFGNERVLDAQQRADGVRVLNEMDRERARREARRRLDAEERGAVVLPDLLPLRERLRRPRPSNRWRIVGWQPQDSRVILAAQFKAGKTTLIGSLIRSLVDGDAFLGRAEVAPVVGSLALLDTEMSGAQLDEWLAAQRIASDDRVFVVPLRGQVGALNLLDPAIRTRWAAALRERGVTYLVLDCLRPVLDALGLDEHREAGRFLVALDALLAEARIAECIVVHHMGHTGERSRGDSRLRDWPDVEWRVARPADDPAGARYITAYGRDVDVPEAALKFDAGTRRLSLSDGSRLDAQEREALAAILDALDTTSALSTRGIQTAVASGGLPRARVRAAIGLGIREGTIVVKRGSRGALLHERAALCRERAGAVTSECASAGVARHTRALDDDITDVAGDGTLGERFHCRPVPDAERL